MIRRQVAELVTRYRRHPTLQDVYVEGAIDRDLLSWALLSAGIVDSRVYLESSIDLGEGLLAKYNLTPGARNRVIVLAKELEESLPPQVRAIAVIDRDLDVILGPTVESPFLISTDYSSMELYLFNEGTIGKFLSLVVGTTVHPGALMAALTTVLTELALIRAARSVMRLNFRLINFGNYAQLSGERVTFDREQFVRNSLVAASLGTQVEVFLDEVERLRLRLPNDPRLFINGHDFIDCLAWYFQKQKRFRGQGAEDYVFRALLGCIDEQVLLSEPLFLKLLKRLISQ